MIGHTFTIIIKLFRVPTAYRMQVEITYHTEQVIRFKITANEKVVEMEKLIIRKTNQWKVKRIHFTTSNKIETQAEAIMKIQDEIDYYLRKNYPKGLV